MVIAILGAEIRGKLFVYTILAYTSITSLTRGSWLWKVEASSSHAALVIITIVLLLLSLVNVPTEAEATHKILLSVLHTTVKCPALLTPLSFQPFADSTLYCLVRR